MARIDAAHVDVGTAVEVGQLDGLQKRLATTVVPCPQFDPGRSVSKEITINPNLSEPKLWHSLPKRLPVVCTHLVGDE